jgi:hypothetical protein
MRSVNLASSIFGIGKLLSQYLADHTTSDKPRREEIQDQPN